MLLRKWLNQAAQAKGVQVFNRRTKDYLGSLQAVSDTVQGRKLFKYLVSIYVDESAMRPSVEETYYRLGQKELIQALLKDAKLTASDLEAVQIITTYGD